MFKALLTIGLFSIGSVGFAGIAYLQSHPLALTRPAPVLGEQVPGTRMEPQRAEVVAAPETVFIAPAAEPVRTASRVTNRRIRVQPKPDDETLTAELRPCSSWREVGTQYVTDGQAIGGRDVRHLCR